LQKIFTILLISLFAISQYAKQLSYIECKLSNNFKTDVTQCNCETKLAEDSSQSPDQPINATHFHVHLDDIYFVKEHALIHKFFAGLNKPNSHYLSFESDGYTKLPLRPPRS
jgi:hypothetical protein